MWFLDDIHNYLIGLLLCAIVMIIVWGLGLFISLVLDVFIGDRK